MINAYKILVGNPEGKRSVGKPQRMYEDGTSRTQGVDWFHVAQDRDRWRAIVNTIMNLWVP
jgi:hypothetical protein